MTGAAFYADVQKKAVQQPFLSYIYDQRGNWDFITADFVPIVGFILATLAAIANIIFLIRSHRSVSLLKKSFSAGLWRGYSHNFLGKVLSSFDELGMDTHIIIGAPSRGIAGGTSGDITTMAFLDSLKKPLEQRGFILTPIQGDKTPAWFRQAFEIKNDESHNHKKIKLFFDIPTTFVAYEGIIEKIAEKEKKYFNKSEKDEYFNDMRNDFFVEMRLWAKEYYPGYEERLIELPIYTRNYKEVADTIIVQIN